MWRAVSLEDIRDGTLACDDGHEVQHHKVTQWFYHIRVSNCYDWDPFLSSSWLKWRWLLVDSFLNLLKKLFPSQSDVASSTQVPVCPEILVISHDDIQVNTLWSYKIKFGICGTLHNCKHWWIERIFGFVWATTQNVTLVLMTTTGSPSPHGAGMKKQFPALFVVTNSTTVVRHMFSSNLCYGGKVVTMFHFGDRPCVRLVLYLDAACSVCRKMWTIVTGGQLCLQAPRASQKHQDSIVLFMLMTHLHRIWYFIWGFNF